MDIYTREFIDGSLKQIPKQNNNSEYLTLFSFTKYHSIFLDFEEIEFSEIFCCYRTPLNNIWGPIEIEDIFYFNNYLFYVLYEKGRATFFETQTFRVKIKNGIKPLDQQKTKPTCTKLVNWE